MPEEDDGMPQGDERMPHKRPKPEDDDPELLPDNSEPPDPNGPESDSDSGSSEELIPDKKVDKPKRLTAKPKPRPKERSVPRRVKLT